MGLCPFHNERTPSFSVNKQKNFCFCFSCKKGGSPVNFIMQKEGLSFRDALIHLANKYGIEVVEKELTDEERKAQSEREAMLVANEWAMLKMEQDLVDTKDGKEIGLSYLFQRGVTMEAIKRFHLGYALDKPSELCKAAKEAGYNLDILKQLGLVGVSGQGNEYDRFRGRVIFPIINSAGKVIAFGGRDLKGGLAKYINSPESNLYKKSNELYGIFQARADIVKEDKCFLVEGYLDVIGMWQSGMRNTVASSGTALTDGQIALIHRFTKNITLIYDGDKAGIKAALRGIDMLLSHNMNVKVLLLPDGDDPDSFARKHTPEEFKEYVKAHETDIIRFKANVLLSDINNDPQSRIEAVDSVVNSIAHISNPIARDVYIQECSQILNVSDESIAKSVALHRAKLVEGWKKERNYKDIQRLQQNNEGSSEQKNVQPQVNTTPSGISSTTTTFPSGNLGNSLSLNEIEATRGSSVTKVAVLSPFIPLEKKVIEYCVKYGFLTLCTYLDDDGIDESIDVVTFIYEELEADGLKFSDNVFNKLFTTLCQLRDKFILDLQQFTLQIDSEADKMLKEGIEKLAYSNKTVSEIERAEKKLNEEIEKFKKEKLTQYAKDYPGRYLASSEDNEIRELTIELLQEPHQLSNIYTRDNNVADREEDKLIPLVPRAVTEWRNEILNQKLNELFNSLKTVQESNKEKEILQQINTIIEARSKVAKEIGDRVLSPRKTGRK